MSAPLTYASIQVTGQSAIRGGPATQPKPVTFSINSTSCTWSWGSEPGEATIVYDFAGVPVAPGQNMVISIAGHTFYGVCLSDKPMSASSGNRRTLRFADQRHWLDYDQVFCAFNHLEDKIVDNTRVKRYVHYLPNTALSLIKSYTDTPYTAAQILNLIFNCDAVLDRWICSYHSDQLNFPVYDIEATGGKSLKALLQEISDQQGLVFTLMGGYNRLVWARKGTNDPRFPGAARSFITPLEPHPVTGLQASLNDDVSVGNSLSGHSTEFIIIGDRNIYQVHEIPLTPDWSLGWAAFYTVDVFRDDIYKRGVTDSPVTAGGQTFPPGTAFIAIGGVKPGDSKVDPEQIVARQQALIKAQTITVGEYAVLRGEDLFLSPPVFADYRKSFGKSRLDMPAELYINQLLFRAFRFPDGFSITAANGAIIPLDSLEVADKLVAKVSHDSSTGKMTWDVNNSADGNGYAIAQGYEVGKDLFRTLNPDRFNLNDWINNQQKQWEHLEFQVDDTGEPDGKTILFNSPIIYSASLVKVIDGYGVFNAAVTQKDGVTPGFDIPPVKIAVCFTAEKYQFRGGAGGRTEVVTVGGLNREVACTYNGSAYEEIIFSDGKTADEKAQDYLNPLLNLQFIYSKGERNRALTPNSSGNFTTPTQLNPYIDRVDVEVSPTGIRETTQLTSEIPRMFYVPERDLDRNVKLKTLLPGQAQLRQEVNQEKIISQQLQINPRVNRTVTQAFRGMFGNSEPLETAYL